jgi:hypothetical protein
MKQLKIPVRKLKSESVADNRQVVDCMVFPERGEQVVAGAELFDQDGTPWVVESVEPFELDPIPEEKRVKKPEAVVKAEARRKEQKGRPDGPVVLTNTSLDRLLRGAHRAKFVGAGDLAHGAWLRPTPPELPAPPPA